MSCHVDRLRCCQLRRTVSVVNWRPIIGHQYIILTVDICVQQDGHKALRRAGLSAARRLMISAVLTRWLLNRKFVCIVPDSDDSVIMSL